MMIIVISHVSLVQVAVYFDYLVIVCRPGMKIDVLLGHAGEVQDYWGGRHRVPKTGTQVSWVDPAYQ
jgi:hypothetical protein